VLRVGGVGEIEILNIRAHAGDILCVSFPLLNLLLPIKASVMCVCCAAQILFSHFLAVAELIEFFISTLQWAAAARLCEFNLLLLCLLNWEMDESERG
jgi:hypothetical protein